jgi:hypothetical protein
VAETVFAREQVVKFLSEKSPGASRPLNQQLARFAQDLLMRHRPGDAGDWNRQDDDPSDLSGQFHSSRVSEKALY